LKLTDSLFKKGDNFFVAIISNERSFFQYDWLSVVLKKTRKTAMK